MYQNQSTINPGETYTILFQLVDLDSAISGDKPNRYIPIFGASMMATMHSFNSANVVHKVPTNPFTDDRSIWSFNLTQQETSYMAGVNLNITLTEGSKVSVAVGKNAIVVAPHSQYSC
jgi:hypothetical protein